MVNVMPSEPILYLLEPDAARQERFENIGSACHCRVLITCNSVGVFDLLRRASPDVVIMGASLPPADIAALCRQIRADVYLRASHILLLEDAAIPATLFGLVDDLMQPDAPDYEVVFRLQNGTRQSQYRRQAIAVQQELENFRGQQEQADDYMTEATTQLVEIAAQLQSEVVHSVEREEESVRAAQADTIAQAAAALRHEINNPLFAIVGSAESALKRLEAIKNTPQPDLLPLVTGCERILRGADRIQKVVEAISAMLTPATTDYVPGVAMLDLTKNAAPTSPPF